MNEQEQIKLWLKEARLYIQFLNEDIDSIESLDESVASQINKLLKEATKNLRESVSLLSLEVKRKKRNKLE